LLFNIKIFILIYFILDTPSVPKNQTEDNWYSQISSST